MEKNTTSEDIRVVLENIIESIMSNDSDDDIPELYKAATVYELDRIAMSLDRLCDIFRGGIDTFPNP